MAAATGSAPKRVGITVTTTARAAAVHVSWYAGTESEVVHALVRRLLGLPADALMLVINADDDAPCQRDAFPLSTAVPSGSALRVLTLDEWSAMPARRRESVAQSSGSSQAPSFLKYHIDALTRCDSSLVPTVQCTVHVQAIVDIDPRCETFGVHFTLMLDWCDEQLAGLRKDDIEEILADGKHYVAPRPQIANLVEGGEELEAAVPRCDNSSKGLVKITAKLKAILQSSMDVHHFPFDRQLLCIETNLRSVTLDKAHLGKGEATRLYIRLEDPARVSIKKRAHQLVAGADKVHEWAFTCERDAMARECEGYTPLLKRYDELQRQFEGARGDDDALLKQEAELLVQIRKAMPVPTPLYQEELSAPLKGTHVVAFELRRRAASVMWTLTLPVFLVTTLSFCQYGVDHVLLAERLQVTLTCILTVVAFQYVVREMVPAVPYRTMMDTFILISLAVMFLQSLASLAVATFSGAYNASRRSKTVIGVGEQRSNSLLELLVGAGSTPNATLQSVLATTAHAEACDANCRVAGDLDMYSLAVLAGSWVVACARFLYMARYWSHSVAWFKDVEFKPRRRNKKMRERVLQARKRQNTPRLLHIVREDAARAHIALPKLTTRAAAQKLAAHRKVAPARSGARPALIHDSSSHSQQPVEHISPSGGATSGGLLKPSDPPSTTTEI